MQRIGETEKRGATRRRRGIELSHRTLLFSDSPTVSSPL